MFGWLSRAKARASRVNRSANAGSRLISGRQDLHGHQPVQFLLPGLVDRPHAAAAEEFEDFQLRKADANSSTVGGTKPEDPAGGEGCVA